MTDQIFLALIEKYPEWNKQNLVPMIKKDIEYILHFAKEDSNTFQSFISWQKELLNALNIDKLELIKLLSIVRDIRTLGLEESAHKNIKEGIKNLHNDTNQPTRTIKELVTFHINLFQELDPSTRPELRLKIENDVTFISDCLCKSISDDDSELFNLFLFWHSNLLEAVDVPKISLIRMLVSMSVFKQGKEKKVLLTAIKILIENNLAPTWSEDYNTASQVTEWHIRLFSHLDKHAKPEFKAHMVADATKHLEFLEQAISAESEILFSEYINWVKSTLNSLKIETITIIRFLATMKMALKLQNHKGENYLNKAIRSLVDSLSLPKADNTNFLNTPEAEIYMEFLIKGDRKGASKYILELVDSEMPIRDIYIEIFQAAQYEMGRLWELNKVSVAQEHFGTATTQMIMSQLYSKIFSRSSNGKNVVATCVGSELHELGIRMVADFLEMDGWNTYYIGSNTPTSAIIDALKLHKADLLALSVTLTPHINKAAEIIEQVKINCPKTKILVGGYPFIKDKELCQRMGGDGVATSARTVHQEAMKLMNN